MRDARETQLVQQVMSHYAAHYRPTHITRVSRAGFSGARIWKLATPTGPFALRLWPQRGLEAPRLLGLHRLLRHVQAHGVSHIAVPMPSLSESSLVKYDNRLWQLEPWLSGAADYLATPSEAKLAAAMIALAQWHLAAATFLPDEYEQRWFAVHVSAPSPGLNERLQLIHTWTPKRLLETKNGVLGHTWEAFREIALQTLAGFQNAAPQIAGELQAAAGIRFRLQPCLRDIWHEHVLFTGETVTGLIDPSACRSETVAGDIARLLGSLVGDDRKAWDTALAAYQTIRPLAVVELGAVELFDRSGVVLSGMTWIERILEDKSGAAEQNLIIERMQIILARLKKLCGE